MGFTDMSQHICAVMAEHEQLLGPVILARYEKATGDEAVLESE